MTCTFVRVEEFEGHKYAVVLSALDGHGTFLDDKNYEETITMNVKGTFYRSMSALAGSRSELRGTMKTEIVVPQNGQKLTMVVTGPVTVTDTNTITQ